MSFTSWLATSKGYKRVLFFLHFWRKIRNLSKNPSWPFSLLSMPVYSTFSSNASEILTTKHFILCYCIFSLLSAAIRAVSQLNLTSLHPVFQAKTLDLKCNAFSPEKKIPTSLREAAKPRVWVDRELAWVFVFRYVCIPTYSGFNCGYLMHSYFDAEVMQPLELQRYIVSHLKVPNYSNNWFFAYQKA